ncbi:MAG: cell division protein FtsB [Gammaproteobacteria bacterium]|nr:cell division protein FtsB [Gammaproteobacteria bacterium]OUV76484.1 MAG: cell division protein FtsB [Gammaproteobacteria bacterium TMED139]
MNQLYLIFCFMIAVLQFQLWIGDDSVRSLNLLEDQVAEQKSINMSLEDRNKKLEIEIVDLKTGVEAIEERARSELGMIEQGETFFLIVE